MSLTTPGWPLFQQPPFPVRRFTVDEYHHMIRTGLLTEQDKVELLEGWIVPKMPRNPPHDGTLDLTQEVLRGCLPSGWRPRAQCAVTLPDSEPEPDVAVVTGAPARYRDHHPGPQEIAFIVEVADSSLARDRNEKARAYAAAGIPVYWIVNLVDTRIEVYTSPSGPAALPRYGQRQDYGPGDLIPLVVGGQQVGQIAVADILP